MFVPGQIIRRKELHALFGGQEQGGISTPASFPIIMLFTGESGLSHGYEDGWTETGIFLYSGEGQIGDMSFVRGNRSLRDHLTDGKDIYLFEYIEPGIVRHVGQMLVSGYHERKGVDSTASERHAIVFELVPALDFEDTLQSPEDKSLQPPPDAEGSDISVPNGVTPDERRVSLWRRRKALRAYIMNRANGKCEACLQAAPFVTANDVPYLELHFLRRATDVGLDDASFVVALCPNCHKRLHLGRDAPQFREDVLNRRGVSRR